MLMLLWRYIFVWQSFGFLFENNSCLYCCCYGQTIGRLNPCKLQTDLIAENADIQDALQAVPVQVDLLAEPVNPPTTETTKLSTVINTGDGESTNTLDTILSVSVEYNSSAITDLQLVCRRNGFRFLEVESVNINCTNLAGTTMLLLKISNFPLCTGRSCNTSIEELDYAPIQSLALMDSGGWETNDFTCITPNTSEEPTTFLGNSIPVSLVVAAAAMFGIVCVIMRKW